MFYIFQTIKVISISNKLFVTWSAFSTRLALLARFALVTFWVIWVLYAWQAFQTWLTLVASLVAFLAEAFDTFLAFDTWFASIFASLTFRGVTNFFWWVIKTWNTWDAGCTFHAFFWYWNISNDKRGLSKHVLSILQILGIASQPL